MKRFTKQVLRDEMARRKMKVPALEKATGIPRDRIYAWYRDNTNPKAEDKDILEKWLNGLAIDKNEEMNISPQSQDDPLPSGGIVVTLADYINELKENNQFLKSVIKDKATSIEANLNLALAYMGKMDTLSAASREVALKSLERLEKKPEGSLIEEVGRVVERNFGEQNKQDTAFETRK